MLPIFIGGPAKIITVCLNRIICRNPGHTTGHDCVYADINSICVLKMEQDVISNISICFVC